MLRAIESPLVNDTPTSSDPSSPGPRVKAMASILRAHARLLERRVHDGNDVLLVRPRGQFGDHAAVFDVNRLRGDDVRQQDVVAEHGGRCVVTRGFDAENCNIHAVNCFFN